LISNGQPGDRYDIRDDFACDFACTLCCERRRPGKGFFFLEKGVDKGEATKSANV
jgi:hypothetical protein